MADLKELNGTTVWVSAGGQIEYYPVVGGKAVYAKPAGDDPGGGAVADQGGGGAGGAEVSDVPDSGRRPAGGCCCLRCRRARRDRAEGATEYAVPVGYRQDGQYTFYNDEIFFYEDPHGLYKHWGPQVWDAIDHHRAILGMSEAQVQMALGQGVGQCEQRSRESAGDVQQPGSSDGCDLRKGQGDGRLCRTTRGGDGRGDVHGGLDGGLRAGVELDFFTGEGCGRGGGRRGLERQERARR